MKFIVEVWGSGPAESTPRRNTQGSVKGNYPLVLGLAILAPWQLGTYFYWPAAYRPVYCRQKIRTAAYGSVRIPYGLCTWETIGKTSALTILFTILPNLNYIVIIC